MSKTKKPRCQRQITLHFNEDTKHILELFEKFAKEDMRTVEAEFLYHLNILSNNIREGLRSFDSTIDKLEKSGDHEPVKMVGDFVGDDEHEAEPADCDMVPQCDGQEVK